MKLDNKKILTSKKVGFAVLITFVFLYLFAVSNVRDRVKIHGYHFLQRMQGFISEKTSGEKTMVTGRNETTPTTKTNKKNMTMQIRKTTTKTVTKNSPKKTTTRILTIKPSKPSQTRKLTIPFQTTTMLVRVNKTSLVTKVNPKTDTTTLKPMRANITTTKIMTTKTPKMTTTKTVTIKPLEHSSLGHSIAKSSTAHPETTTRPKHFICVHLMGRLGNLMFEYASAYGIARSKGMDVIISENERIVKVFHLNRGGKVVKDTSMCKGVKKIPEVQASAFDKRTLGFNNDKNVGLQGYLQSYKYFENFSDDLRRQFTFRDSIKTKADGVIRAILKQNLVKHNNKTVKRTLIGVHVRRGDMVNHRHGYMVAPKEYFQRSQNMFRAIYKNVQFVVCSDDIKWCRANLQSNDTYFVEGNSAEVDMAILSSCNHTISSVGSFSWWSAWLANGLVTYYCPPARPGSGLRKAYSKDFTDYFPPKWIRIKL